MPGARKGLGRLPKGCVQLHLGLLAASVRISRLTVNSMESLTSLSFMLSYVTFFGVSLFHFNQVIKEYLSQS